MPRNDLLVWMDLEMTSVTDARVDQIIEAAVILTDKDLSIVAEGPDLIIHADQALFDQAPPDAQELARKSGIMELSLQSMLSVKEAEEEILAFLTTWVEPRTAPLCGNSIHMDRHFLRLQMPRVEEHLFYRCIDVSTIKELARRWQPDLYEEARSRKGESAHRAHDDIRASISELAFYRGALFTH